MPTEAVIARGAINPALGSTVPFTLLAHGNPCRLSGKRPSPSYTLSSPSGDLESALQLGKRSPHSPKALSALGASASSAPASQDSPHISV